MKPFPNSMQCRFYKRVYVEDDNGYEVEVDPDIIDEVSGRYLGLVLEGPAMGKETVLSESIQKEAEEKLDAL